MSCYFRHIKDILDEAGIEVTPDNKKQIDQAIHQIVEVNYKACPHAWRKLKQDIIGNEQKRRDFTERLRAAMS